MAPPARVSGCAPYCGKQGEKKVTFGTKISKSRGVKTLGRSCGPWRLRLLFQSPPAPNPNFNSNPPNDIECGVWNLYRLVHARRRVNFHIHFPTEVSRSILFYRIPEVVVVWPFFVCFFFNGFPRSRNTKIQNDLSIPTGDKNECNQKIDI